MMKRKFEIKKHFRLSCFIDFIASLFAYFSSLTIYISTYKNTGLEMFIKNRIKLYMYTFLTG